MISCWNVNVFGLRGCKDVLKNVNVDLLYILMYFCLFFPNNECTLPKTIDLTDFSASERSDIGLMSELYNVFF